MQGFSQADNEKQWISGLRKLYRFMPFARSTYHNAAAIIAASSQTYSEFATIATNFFLFPEPGIEPFPVLRRPARSGAECET